MDYVILVQQLMVNTVEVKVVNKTLSVNQRPVSTKNAPHATQIPKANFVMETHVPSTPTAPLIPASKALAHFVLPNKANSVMVLNVVPTQTVPHSLVSTVSARSVTLKMNCALELLARKTVTVLVELVYWELALVAIIR